MGSLAWYDLDNQLSSRIILAAQTVYRVLGPGCSEQQYRKAITLELRRHQLDVQSRFPVDVWQANELVDLYFLDLFVEMQAVGEIRSRKHRFLHSELEDLVERLDTSGAKMGLIFNFGLRALEYQRVLPSRPRAAL